MTPISVLIVDDEPLAHQLLQSYCDKVDFLEVAGHCYDGISTLNFLNSHPVDALFLDIQMPDLTGLELLDTLRRPELKVVFTTAYSEYALEGFDYDQVVDYLHKPIRLTRFLKAAERLNRQLTLERNYQRQEEVEKPASEPPSTDFISLRDQKTVYRVGHREINYIQSWGNYLKFFLDDGQVKVIRGTMKEMEQTLPKKDFVRIHKSFLVNAQKVTAISGNQVVLQEIQLPLGKGYAISARKQITGNPG